MTKYNRILLFTLLLILCTTFTVAQDTEDAPPVDPLLTQIIPPSPEAASLGKFGEIPVNTFTGIPTIDIPIHTVSGRNIQVPISLSYHAGGIKVQEIASRVGLGWSLNAGGVITRTVHGLPDEYTYGYLAVAYEEHLSSYNDGAYPNLEELVNIYESGSEPNVRALPAFTGLKEVYKDVVEQRLDLEPDMFYFNVGGKSGKILITSMSEGVAIPYEDLTIEFELEEVPGGTRRHIVRWKITTSDGTTYIFGRSQDNTVEAIEKTESRQVGGNFDINTTPIGEYNSAWYLTEIIAPEVPLDLSDQNTYSDIIRLEYNSYETEIPELRYSESRSICTGIGSPPPVVTNSYSTLTKGVLLKEIRSLTERVNFYYSTSPRLDLPTTSTDSSLSKVYIKGFDGNILSSFDFTTGYFQNTTATDNTPAWQRRRLKLMQIQETGVDGTSKNPYIFSYNESYSIPTLNSSAHDYWGYYNGQDGNTTLIPQIRIDGFLFNSPSDRKPNENAMKTATLTAIQYPTGGKTLFEFEPHIVHTALNFDTFEPLFIQVAGVNTTTEDDDDSGIRQVVFPVGGETPNPENSDEKGSFVKVKIETEISGCGSPGDLIDCPCLNPDDPTSIGCASFFRIIDMASNNILFNEAAQNGEFVFFLPQGLYRFYFDRLAPSGGPINKTVLGTLHIQEDLEDGQENRQVIGGLRVARMTHQPHDEASSEDQVTTFTYQRVTDPNKSSGVLLSRPIFSYKSSNNPTLASRTEFCTNIYATAQGPLSTAQGQIVVYDRVEMIYQNKEGTQFNGRTVNEFEVFPGMQDVTYPFAPAYNRNEIKNGNLRLASNDKSINSSISANETPDFQTIKATSSEYTYNFKQYIRGVKVGCLNSGGPFKCYQPVFDLYTRETGWKFLHSSEEGYIYSDAYPRPVIRKTLTFHESPNHIFPTRIQTLSTKRIHESRITYNLDDNTSLSNTVLSAMRDKKMVLPVKREEFEGPSENQLSQITGRSTIYENWGTADDPVLKPNRIALYHTIVPGQGTYEDRANSDFDPTYGFLKAQNLVGTEKKTVYLWGYNYARPVAMIEGVEYAEALAEVSQSLLNDPPNEQSLLTELAKLRTGLPNALVTTYTYNNRLQVSSITSPDGITTTYTYDGLGRLIETKDDDNKKLQEIQYNYGNR